MQRLLWCRVAQHVAAYGPLLRQPHPSPVQLLPFTWRGSGVSTSGTVRAAAPGQRDPGQEGQPVTPQRHSEGVQAQVPTPDGPTDTDPLQDKSMGLVQRFKKTFKQYGKVMIPVHLLTSSIWFGAFYYTAMKGVNVVPFLEYVGFPEKLVTLMEKSQSGYAITAYAMYKIATPARYTVTLAGTSLSVKYLRSHGYMSTPPPVKEYIQDKMEETRERLTEKMEETKDRISGRMGETKGKFSEKLQETKDKISFRKKNE